MSKEKVEIELSANSAKLKSEFDEARAKVKKFQDGVGRAVKSVGGLAVGMLGLAGGIRVLNELREKFDRIGKLANRFEMPVEEVQRLQVAADLSGASLEKLAGSLVRGNTAAYDAMNGSKQVADAFAAMGISAEEFAAAGQTKKVEMLADAYNSAADKSTAMAAGTKILGRGFAELVPLLKNGGDGIREMTAGLQVLGESEIKAIEKFNDDLTVLKSNVQAGVAKKFAGEMEQLAPLIIATGQSLANFTGFVVKHSRAIGLLIGAVAAYKGAKFAVAMAKDLAAVVRTGVALMATKAATDAETAAVTKNTAAHLANANARGGKGAAAGKVAGSAIAAVIAFQIGKLAGDKLAGKLQESFEESFRAANAPANDLLKTIHEMVTTAKTVEETTAARGRITAEIARLEKENQSLSDGLKKSANEHAIATLKIWEKNADNLRIRSQQLEVEQEISGEYEFQLQQQAFSERLAMEGMAAAKKRMEAMQKAAESIRATIAALKGEIMADQVDLLPPEKKIRTFTDQLKSGLKKAVGEFNFGREGRGLDIAGADSESLKGLWNLAQQAQREGNDGLAKSLFEQVRELQKTQAQITAAKGEVSNEAAEAAQKELDATRERLQKEEEIARMKRGQEAAKSELGAELAILRLEANGEAKKAEELQRQIRLRKEAKEIAEATGITEEEALRIARQRDALKQRADTIKAGETSNGDDDKGKRRIRLYNAQESLQRRLGRQSRSGSRANMNSMDMRTTDLGERFVRDADARKAGPLSAVVKGNDAVPEKLDELIDLEGKLVKIFENVIKV